MTTANASCPLDISPTTIAAWRDGALSSDESARIAAHVSGCAACRREMALYESLDNALRRQPVPASDERLWRSVRAGMVSNSRGPRNTGRTVRRMVGATSALAAVLLLAMGFAQIFRVFGVISNRPSATATTTTVQGTPPPLPTAIPAAPAMHGATPNWQPGNFPTSGITFGDKSADILSFGVAATDGATAYACYSQTNSGGSLITMYRTSDRAIHWTQLIQLPLPVFQTSDCTVEVDTLDANRALVGIWGQDLQNLREGRYYELTEDGGATWTKLPSSDILYGIATVNGRTYALRDQVVGQQSNGLPKVEHHLSVSTDHLRSWQPIDSSLVALGKSVSQFWARPDGELLVEAATTSSSSPGTGSTTPTALPTSLGQPSLDRTLLWRTDDGGAHWNLFLLPALSNNDGFGALSVQQPIAGGQPWRVCADAIAYSSRLPTGIVCTLDGGKTWTVRPYLCASAPCAATPAPGFAGLSETLTADGSLLMLAPDKTSHLGLYRLPPDSSQWQYLGPMTGSIFYIASAHGGALWQFAGGVYVGGFFSGDIGGHLGSLPSVLLSTASYP